MFPRKRPCLETSFGDNLQMPSNMIIEEKVRNDSRNSDISTPKNQINSETEELEESPDIPNLNSFNSQMINQTFEHKKQSNAPEIPDYINYESYYQPFNFKTQETSRFEIQ